MLLAVALVVGLSTYGPTMSCLAGGGEPAMNALGAEWCAKDGDGELSPGDSFLRR